MIIVGQSLLGADLGLPGVCVCVLYDVCVLTRIELWIYQSDFNVTLVAVYYYSPVVHHKVWEKLAAPFMHFRGRQKFPY